MHAPFSGDIAEGLCLGAAARDKGQLVAILEANEPARHDRLPAERHDMFAFGQDEEVAVAKACDDRQALSARGTHFAWVWTKAARS